MDKRNTTLPIYDCLPIAAVISLLIANNSGIFRCYPAVNSLLRRCYPAVILLLFSAFKPINMKQISMIPNVDRKKIYNNSKRGLIFRCVFNSRGGSNR